MLICTYGLVTEAIGDFMRLPFTSAPAFCWILAFFDYIGLLHLPHAKPKRYFLHYREAQPDFDLSPLILLAAVLLIFVSGRFSIHPLRFMLMELPIHFITSPGASSPSPSGLLVTFSISSRGQPHTYG